MQCPNFSQVRVLVVGDVMLDEYWHGLTSRISPEAPVPVVRVDGNEVRAGGAANVALNIVALGAKACVIGLVGNDAAGKQLQLEMEKSGVEADCLIVPGASTIKKLRVMSRHQQMIRLDFEDGFIGFDTTDFQRLVENKLPEYDLLILSDYDKGCLKRADLLIEMARKLGIPVLADPKGRDFTKYADASLITPNEAELRLVTGDWSDEASFSLKSSDLKSMLKLDALLVTRSECGMSLFTDDSQIDIPTLAKDVADVTGAGDTVIASLGVAIASGMALPDAVRLSNAAAGVVVGKLGTDTVSVSELNEAMRNMSTCFAPVL